jgi:triosephosphate isomerase
VSASKPKASLPLILGNWKMNCTRAQATKLALQLKDRIGAKTDREVGVAPPFTALQCVASALAGSRIRLGAQNLHWEPKGAYTGEVSAEMLKEAACDFVIIGHSERRRYFQETDEGVRKKILAAARAGLDAVVCVGETEEEREAGKTAEVIRRQVEEGLRGILDSGKAGLSIAYEPVWAIGTGKTATPEQAAEVHAMIRELLGGIAGEEQAAAIRIIYGGSVKPENIDELMARDEIEGVLVGGASLDASSFARIVNFE